MDLNASPKGLKPFQHFTFKNAHKWCMILKTSLGQQPGPTWLHEVGPTLIAEICSSAFHVLLKANCNVGTHLWHGNLFHDQLDISDQVTVLLFVLNLINFDSA